MEKQLCRDTGQSCDDLWYIHAKLWMKKEYVKGEHAKEIITLKTFVKFIPNLNTKRVKIA